MFVGHAASLEAATRQLVGHKPRPAQEFVKIVQKVFMIMCVAISLPPPLRQKPERNPGVYVYTHLGELPFISVIVLTTSTMTTYGCDIKVFVLILSAILWIE